MRISDWSSDVCSSDLHPQDTGVGWPGGGAGRCRFGNRSFAISQTDSQAVALSFARSAKRLRSFWSLGGICAMQYGLRWPSPSQRSEEHTSELQSLMRISYAVFCWKKKIITI